MPTPEPNPNPPEPFAYRPADARRPHDPAAPSGPTLEAPRRTPAQPQPKRARRPLKWLVYALLPIAGLAALGAGFFLAAPPAALLQSHIAEAVKARTGRDLAVAGPTAFRFLPSPGLVMDNVSLSAPSGMDGGPAIAMRRLDVAIAVWPLLRRDLSIKRVVLSEPIIDLRVDKSGRRTWDFAEDETHPPIRLAENESAVTVRDAPSTIDANPEKRPPAPDSIAIGEVRIENGTLHYSDERKGISETVSGVDLAITSKGLEAPLSFEGRAAWSGTSGIVKGELGSAAELAAKRASPMKLAVSSPAYTVSFDGLLSLVEQPRLEGKFEARAGALSGMRQWVETGSSDAIVRARLEAAPRSLKLSGAKLESETLKAEGNVSIDASGPRPVVRGTVEIPELDLNKLAPDRAAALEVKRRDAAAPKSEDSRSIEELLDREPPQAGGPQVKGYSRRDWSDDLVVWPWLGLADAEVELRLARLLYRDLKAGPATVAVTMKEKTLEAKSNAFDLYGGKGRGALAIKSAGNETSLSATCTAENIDARALLSDAAGLDWLSGKGAVSFSVAGKGPSESEIVRSLAGKGTLSVNDGAIRGFDAGKILRTADKGRAGGKKDDAATEFAKLSATFTVTNGVAETKDLMITSPLVTATGMGSVRLPDKELDLLLHPKITAKPAGEGGNESTASIEIPVRLHGPWNKPKASADLSAVVKNPDKAIEAAKEIGKKLKGKGFGDLVRGIIGDGNKGKDGSPAAGRDEAKDAPSESVPR